jgi:hypothetical protein
VGYHQAGKQAMIDPKIPDEAVEAMLNRMGSFFSSEEARAAIAAAINAWPGMWQDDLSQQFLTVWEKQFLILPLPEMEEKP